MCSDPLKIRGRLFSLKCDPVIQYSQLQRLTYTFDLYTKYVGAVNHDVNEVIDPYLTHIARYIDELHLQLLSDVFTRRLLSLLFIFTQNCSSFSMSNYSHYETERRRIANKITWPKFVANKLMYVTNGHIQHEMYGMTRADFPNTPITYDDMTCLPMNFVKFVDEWEPHVHRDLFFRLQIDFWRGTQSHDIKSLSNVFRKLSKNVDYLYCKFDRDGPSQSHNTLSLPSVTSLEIQYTSHIKYDMSLCRESLTQINLYGQSDISFLDVIARANLLCLMSVMFEIFELSDIKVLLQLIINRDAYDYTLQWFKHHEVALYWKVSSYLKSKFMNENRELAEQMKEKHGIYMYFIITPQ